MGGPKSQGRGGWPRGRAADRGGLPQSRLLSSPLHDLWAAPGPTALPVTTSSCLGGVCVREGQVAQPHAASPARVRQALPSPGTAGLPSPVPTATGFSSQTALCHVGKNLDPTKFSFLTQEKINTRFDLTRAPNVSPLILTGDAGREWTAGSGHPPSGRWTLPPGA